MSDTQSSNGSAPVGIIGLGIMGSAIARNLIRNGHRVIGFDISQPRCAEMRADNITIASSAVEVAASADIVLLSLPSAAALTATVDALLAAPPPLELIVAELSTLSLEDKTANHDRLAEAGIVLLDCPLSGTGAQALTGDLVVYASGDADACARCDPVFAGFARASSYLGAFGNGTRMKFVANLLVAIHNVAAAEAIVLGARAGLDPAMMCQVLANGAGSSRMLEIRGPSMVSGHYEPAAMRLDLWRKDMGLIAEFAHACGVATPLFSTTAELYETACTEGGERDTAAVYTVLESMVRPD